MANDFVRWDGLYERDLVVGLEVAYLLFDLADDLKVVHAELELRVNVYLVGNFSECITHNKDKTTLQSGFEINFPAVFYEEGYPRLILRAF